MPIVTPAPLHTARLGRDRTAPRVSMDRILHPRSVAVFGASDSTDKFGGRLPGLPGGGRVAGRPSPRPPGAPGGGGAPPPPPPGGGAPPPPTGPSSPCPPTRSCRA